MRKTLGYQKDEKIRYLKDIISNFEKFEIGKKYCTIYNSHFRDYEYILQKLNENTIYAYIFHNKVEIIKKDEGKFEIAINLNDYMTIAKMRRIIRFLHTENDHFYSYLIGYSRGVWKLILGNLVIPIRSNSRKIKLTIKRKTEEHYLTLPELQKVLIPEREYGFPLVSGELYLYKFNNKKVENIVKFYEKKYKGMPYLNRVKLQNRKIEYAFMKMLIKKGIFKYDYDITPSTPMRLGNSAVKYNKWEFTNIAIPHLNRMRPGEFPNFWHVAIQDYDDDGVNQVLLKYVDNRNHTYLCGIDYGNSIWCMQLQGFMLKFRIKSVYKTLYQLDDKTKIFEF